MGSRDQSYTPGKWDINGFTLVELMIALFIFSLLSVAGVILLRGAVITNEATDEKLGEMAGMQRFVSLMEADLSQALPRPHRDDDGQRHPAFQNDVAESRDIFLMFTRGGQSNVNNAPRPNLQRVVYSLEDGEIARAYHDRTDGGPQSEKALLLDEVNDMQLRFRDKRGQWRSDWQTERLSELPRAIEIRLTRDGRSYRHVFLVGTGYL